MDIKMIMVPNGKVGKVTKINFQIGDYVKKDDELCIVEAGKGSRAIKSSADAIVKEIFFNDGDIANTNDLIMVLEEGQQSVDDDGSCDLLVIGGGPGGYVAAIYAAKKGKKVTLIEKERLGGTCLNVGCIPTKALVKSSEIVTEILNAEKFGIKAKLDEIDMKKVISHKDSVVDRLVGGIEFLMEKNDIKVIKGTASFANDNTVYVNEKSNVIPFKNAIIATGSKITSIKIPGIDNECVLNSTKALSLDKLPKSIAIIGGGVIGMEFAFIYAHFGVKVFVVEFLDHLLGNVDNEASLFMKKKAEDEGIEISLNSRVTEITQNGDEATVTFVKNDKKEEIKCEKVLVAIGRQANLEELTLSNTSIEIDDKKRAIKVNDRMQTSVENIFAIGDATNIIQLAHVASHQALVAVDNIFGEVRHMCYDAVPSVIFTDPEVASVGYTAEQALREGMTIKESHFNYQSNGKALTMEKGEGFIKLVKDINLNKIIGATIVGVDASTLIATLTLAITNGLSEKEIIKTVFAHPTTAEVIHEAALGLSIGSLHE